MAIKKLITDEWKGQACDDHEIDEPVWADVVGAIRRLDQKTYTQVVLQNVDESLLIGGGAGRYNLAATLWRDGTEIIYVLERPEEVEGKERLVAGGQFGFYPARTVVDYYSAIRAIEHFYNDGIPRLDDGWKIEHA